ncbi:MAG: AAA family ATPase, partial [Aquiluna sp.]
MESPSPFVLAESMPLRAPKAVEDFEPSGSAVIIGAPLTGKTTALRHFVAREEKLGTKAEEILVITPSRLAAAILRDQIALDSHQASAAPRARSISSIAFEILGGRGPIRLLSGAHQQMLLQRLAGEHLVTGKAAEWGLSKE